jgi:hypothetical protein
VSHKYSFDSKCLDLAEHFLPSHATQECKNELAQSIQDTVENFMMVIHSEALDGLRRYLSQPEKQS